MGRKTAKKLESVLFKEDANRAFKESRAFEAESQDSPSPPPPSPSSHSPSLSRSPCSSCSSPERMPSSIKSIPLTSTCSDSSRVPKSGVEGMIGCRCVIRVVSYTSLFIDWKASIAGWPEWREASVYCTKGAGPISKGD